jgi:hypothetical protein
MLLKEIKKSRGQVAKIILVLAIIVLIALGIAFFVMRKNVKTPVKSSADNLPPPPVYNIKVSNVNFTLMDNVDLGDTLLGKESRKPKFQEDLKTTERFIQVTIGAQNAGKADTKKGIWDVGNIIDDQGRNFIPEATTTIANWLAEDHLHDCGSILKPIFTPTPCIKIYPVAKGSTGLKIQVFVLKSIGSSERTTELLDLRPMY